MVKLLLQTDESKSLQKGFFIETMDHPIHQFSVIFVALKKMFSYKYFHVMARSTKRFHRQNSFLNRITNVMVNDPVIDSKSHELRPSILKPVSTARSLVLFFVFSHRFAATVAKSLGILKSISVFSYSIKIFVNGLVLIAFHGIIRRAIWHIVINGWLFLVPRYPHSASFGQYLSRGCF